MDLKVIIMFILFSVVLLGLLFLVYGIEVIKHKDDKKFKPH